MLLTTNRNFGIIQIRINFIFEQSSHRSSRYPSNQNYLYSRHIHMSNLIMLSLFLATKRLTQHAFEQYYPLQFVVSSEAKWCIKDNRTKNN